MKETKVKSKKPKQNKKWKPNWYGSLVTRRPRNLCQVTRVTKVKYKIKSKILDEIVGRRLLMVLIETPSYYYFNFMLICKTSLYKKIF